MESVMTTTTETVPVADHAELPPLSRDRSFWGMTATQFLGAFNDNLYKQMVLLICLDYVRVRQLDHDPYQGWAQAMFALAFVMFSGLAGWLSDRTSKRTIVVVSKVLEIAIMAAAGAVFLLLPNGGDAFLAGLIFVLFLMGVQSAFFGPAKYGILPEMLRERDLPLANGLIQMTTFLAIIGGTAVCGLMKDWLGEGDRLWIISGACIFVAIVGTVTSLWVRPTPIAQPGLKLNFGSLFVHGSTWRMLRADRMLMFVLLATVLFWFLGGVAMLAVNTFGKEQVGLGDTATSILTACIGLGIALGCVIAGAASRHRVDFRLVTIGSWGMFAAFCALTALPRLSIAGWTAREYGFAAAPLLVLLGVSAGLYAVPLQVFLQSRPPADQKGRMIGTMNLFTWIGILFSAVTYRICTMIFGTQAIAWTFLVLGAIILPVALFYRPRIASSEPA